MNRKEMAEQINDRVPFIEQRDSKELTLAEHLRLNFIKDYPLHKIPQLKVDEYVIGKDKKSFCYRLEQPMDCLGRIKGATAFKFGVYYGKIKSDPAHIYRYAQHCGSTFDEAFTNVKKAITTLLSAASANDNTIIARTKISPMIKGKLLHLYFPEQYAPIYSKAHLLHFVSALDIGGDFSSEVEMQRALMQYRQSWPTLASKSPILYMHFLYDLFGYPTDKEDEDSEPTDSRTLPLLQQAIEGATDINTLPQHTPVPPDAQAGTAKPDYDAQRKRLKRIGDRGEAIVFALEVARLKAIGKMGLSARVRHVSQETDREGYDILSFDDDGTPRQIEVKATSYPDLSHGFYLSANELEASQQLPNYHLYLVFSAMSKAPRILRMRRPAFDGNGASFATAPIMFHVRTRPTPAIS